LTAVVSDKNKKEKEEKRKSKVPAVLLLMLLAIPASSFAEVTTAVVAQTNDSVDGIPFTDFYSLIAVITLELLVIFALAIYVNVLLKIIKGEPEEIKSGEVAAPRKSWFWDKFNKAATPEKEREILLDHNYDGIQELDNSLPPWWKYGFYLTIVVAVIYLYRFHISHDGMSQQEEYVAEMQQGEEDKAAYLAKSANNVDESNVTQLTDGAAVAAGKELFEKNCVACHLADGGGSVGPNLTDEYWIHSGGIKDVFKSIKYGWQDKGMKSWKDDFSPMQLQQLASFVKSLKGTHPATPKAPQGDKYIEAVTVSNAVAKEDSVTKTK
jgi:cytochrome c oxidase cbb3-type subunit 3